MDSPTWLYKQTETGEYPLWTVGHYEPNGRWVPESDHDSKEEAAKRVHYLNGGTPDLLEALKYAASVFEAQLDHNEPYYKQAIEAIKKATL